MKRDGRTLAHNTLEEMRVLAVQRMAEGERPADVAASFGLHRSWAFKCRAAARGRGKGLKALRSSKGTGRPRKLTVAQEQQMFRWINGKSSAMISQSSTSQFALPESRQQGFFRPSLIRAITYLTQ